MNTVKIIDCIDSPPCNQYRENKIDTPVKKPFKAFYLHCVNVITVFLSQVLSTHSLSSTVHIQANLEDDLVKEALRTVSEAQAHHKPVTLTLFTAISQQASG